MAIRTVEQILTEARATLDDIQANADRVRIITKQVVFPQVYLPEFLKETLGDGDIRKIAVGLGGQ